jgi:hypothetical protein
MCTPHSGSSRSGVWGSFALLLSPFVLVVGVAALGSLVFSVRINVRNSTHKNCFSLFCFTSGSLLP